MPGTECHRGLPIDVHAFRNGPAIYTLVVGMRAGETVDLYLGNKFFTVGSVTS
jgi:hypothetical protein